MTKISASVAIRRVYRSELTLGRATAASTMTSANQGLASARETGVGALRRVGTGPGARRAPGAATVGFWRSSTALTYADGAAAGVGSGAWLGSVIRHAP